MASLRFTNADPADRDGLVAMMEHFYATQSLAFTPAVVAAMETLLATPRLGFICLLHVDMEIAGYFALTYGYSLERAGHTALLDELYILPAHRNRGHGTAALRFAIDSARSQGCQSLHIEVDHANADAQALYTRLGFITHKRNYLTLHL